jgi:hypothetical protein
MFILTLIAKIIEEDENEKKKSEEHENHVSAEQRKEQ